MSDPTRRRDTISTDGDRPDPGHETRAARPVPDAGGAGVVGRHRDRWIFYTVLGVVTAASAALTRLVSVRAEMDTAFLRTAWAGIAVAALLAVPAWEGVRHLLRRRSMSDQDVIKRSVQTAVRGLESRARPGTPTSAEG